MATAFTTLVGSEKGGVAKTSIATSLAAMLAGAGHDTLIVDTDTQSNAAYWATIRSKGGGLPHVSCVQLFSDSIVAQVNDLKRRYKHIIIDAGGRDSVELRASMVVADYLICPTQSGQFDIWTISKMNDLVKQARGLNRSLRSGVIITRASPNPKVSESDEASELLAEYDALEWSGIVIRDRIAWRKAAREGRGVTETDSVDEKAVAEIGELYNHVYNGG